MPDANNQLIAARAQIRSRTTGHPLSRAELAELVNAWVFQESGRVIQLSGNYIGKLERGIFRWPSADCRAGLRAVLGVETDAELGLRPVDRCARLASIEPERDAVTVLPLAGEEVDDVLRRTFFLNASLAGVGAALGLESARHGLNRAVGADVTTDLADWYEVVREYGDVHVTDTAIRVREMLLVDIFSLQIALGETATPDRRRELYKVGAVLSHYMAQAVGDLGQQREARRWWRTARHAADSSGDLHAILYVRGRAAIRDIYDGRPPRLILDAVDEADELMAKGPHIGLPSLYAARAQSLALLGRADEAESALGALRDVFATLPSDMTGDHGWHCWAYPEERVRFAESFVYSHLGNVGAAEKAQQAALSLYPPSSVRGPVQIELQRALCLVCSGDLRQGARHATVTLERLPTEYRTRFVMGLGEQVLAAVPPDERDAPSAKDLRELLGSDALRLQKALQS